MDKSSSFDNLSEPDKQSTPNLHSRTSRQKRKQAELSLQLDEAQRQIRRLNQTIEKLSQREKNNIMYFEQIIKDLESANKDFKNRLDCNENCRQRSRRSIMAQSKIKRSCLNQSYYPASSMRSPQENKENMNNLNTQQILKCDSPFCEAKQQLEEIRSLSTETINIINNILYSIKIRQQSQWVVTDYDEWAKQMENERAKRKMDGNKSSIQLVRLMQQKLKGIHECMQNQPQKSELVSQQLFQSLKSLRQKQKNLMKIPFLEKIDIERRRQDTNCFMESAQMIKERISTMLKEK